MKKVLITMTMLLTLGMGVSAVAQNHRHTPRTQEELVDSANNDAVEVFSDTTMAASSTTTTVDDWMDDDNDVDEQIERAFSNVIAKWDGDSTTGMLFVLGILFVIFVLPPVLIIVLLIYFIYKNRKQRMKLAQMAMQQGQPIPEQLLEEKVSDVDAEYQRGMRQCFVGVGLMIFLGYAAGNVGFGIGALVFCIGLGKVFASRVARKKNESSNNDIINSGL